MWNGERRPRCWAVSVRHMVSLWHGPHVYLCIEWNDPLGLEQATWRMRGAGWVHDGVVDVEQKRGLGVDGQRAS